MSLLREHFPLLASRTYLCSHSLGAVPTAARQALEQYWREWAELGIAAWDGPWWQTLLDWCADLEALLGAAPGTVAPFPNATAALAAVVSCFLPQGRRRRVVLTDLEFTTAYPFWRAHQELGFELTVVNSPDGVTVPLEHLVQALDETVLMVFTSHVYFRSGAAVDLAGLTRAAHQVGALVVGDGYQAVGTLPVDVTRLEVDFYLGGCHKWLCGGPGAGWLYVRPQLLPDLRPRLRGWFGLREPFRYSPGSEAGELHPGAWRLLGGTPNVPGLYASREGLRLVRRLGLPAIRAHSQELAEALIAGADARGLRVRTPRRAQERSGMICLDFPRSQEACEALAESGVMVDWRPDCGLRVSAHFYNSRSDVERFFAELDRFLRGSSRSGNVGGRPAR